MVGVGQHVDSTWIWGVFCGTHVDGRSNFIFVSRRFKSCHFSQRYDWDHYSEAQSTFNPARLHHLRRKISISRRDERNRALLTPEWSFQFVPDVVLWRLSRARYWIISGCNCYKCIQCLPAYKWGFIYTPATKCCAQKNVPVIAYYDEREENTFSVKQLCIFFNSHPGNGFYFSLIVMMAAGGFTGLWKRALQKMRTNDGQTIMRLTIRRWHYNAVYTVRGRCME